MPENQDLLIPVDKYLAAGVHIGTQQREASMRPFIYNVRPDGLSVFNIQLIDKRIRTCGKFIAKFEKEDILMVSARDNSRESAEKFSELTGIKVVSDRFMPGTLTNPEATTYLEPKLMMVSDPILDSRAINEAVLTQIPIIAFCDTNNTTKNVDIVLPGNNKGRKSLSTVLWLLAREALRARGELKQDQEPKYTLEEFQGTP